MNECGAPHLTAAGPELLKDPSGIVIDRERGGDETVAGSVRGRQLVKNTTGLKRLSSHSQLHMTDGAQIANDAAPGPKVFAETAVEPVDVEEVWSPIAKHVTEAANASDASVHAQNALLRQHDVECALHGLLLGLGIEDAAREIDFTLIELEVFVLQAHVHPPELAASRKRSP